MPALDVLIPTSKERLDNLLFQISSVFLQGIKDVRLTIAMNGNYPELEERLSAGEKEKIRWVKDAPEGLIGNPAVNHCMNTLDWSDWYFQIGDDDCLCPWGLRHLFEAREGQLGVIIGKALVVSKDDHRDFTWHKVGEEISPAKVSGASTLFNFRKVETLEKPWWNPDKYMADYELIRRLGTKYPYKIIPNTVCVLPLEVRKNFV